MNPIDLDLFSPRPEKPRPPAPLLRNPATTKRFIPVSVLREDALPGRSQDSPDAIHEFWQAVIATQPDFEPEKEQLVVILTSARMRAFAWHRVSLGTVSETSFHPREILRPAILGAASHFILAHNHPSGDPSPSQADSVATRKIREAGELIGISLLDHVIIGRPAPGRMPYYSFREAGLIN